MNLWCGGRLSRTLCVGNRQQGLDDAVLRAQHRACAVLDTTKLASAQL